MIAAIIPGPSDPNCEQVQFATRPTYVIDELKELYTNGKVMPAFKCPDGEYSFTIIRSYNLEFILCRPIGSSRRNLR